MVVHFPHFFVVRVVVLLQPSVPGISTGLDTGLVLLVDVDSPLASNATEFLSADSPRNLHSLPRLC